MRFIQVWSYSCANHLALQLKENHEKRRVYYFGLQALIGELVKTVFLVIISLILGTFLPTLLISVFFASLRTLAGGYHMDTYGKCMISTLSIFILAGIFAQHTYLYWETTGLLIFTIAVFASGIFILKKWAPADTPNKPITEPEEIRKFKRLSISYILVWFPLMLVLLYFKLNICVLSGCMGILLSASIVTPLGYRLFQGLSRSLDKVGKNKKRK